MFLLKKWAYVIFIFQQLLFIILVICNILFTEKSTLLKAGWKDSEQLLSGYRLIMCIAVLIGVAFIIWVTSYRRYFVEHKQTITSGAITIKNAKAPHVTFHPPKILQQSGIINFTTANGKVDSWSLAWFPVEKKQLLACITVKDFLEISNAGKPKKQHKVIPMQSDLRSFRMNIEINPRNTQLAQLHDSKALSDTNIHGYSPKYILSLRFYRDNSQITSIYMASDTIIKA